VRLLELSNREEPRSLAVRRATVQIRCASGTAEPVRIAELSGCPLTRRTSQRVCLTTGVKLRGPERSEGHVSCNAELCRVALVSLGTYSAKTFTCLCALDSRRISPGFVRRTTGVQLRGPEGAQRLRATSASTSE
jgi:hypothetical protein